MLHYIIQTIAFQLLFLLAYDLLLKNETFFNYNRLYLLLTSVLSIVLPFIKIESLNQVLPKQFIVNLPEVVLGNTIDATQGLIVLGVSKKTVSSILNIQSIYLAIAIFMFLFFAFKLSKILLLIFKNESTKVDKLTIVSLKKTNTAFSFFNFIFLGETLAETKKQHILEHERIHAKQKHSLDLLWFEFLKIVFWFNPLIYFYQNKISNLHEFIADKNAVKINKSNYYQQLLQEVFSVKNCTFINPFFKQSLIKKRIVMLQKSKSKQSKLVKYVLLIPMILAMLAYTSCNQDETETVDVDTVRNNLTEAQLIANYVEEFKTKYDNPFDAITEDKVFQNKNYLNTLTEYAKTQASFVILNEYMVSNGKGLKKLPVHKTYKEYLEFKKTQEAKDKWENSPKRGTLRLLVQDIDALSGREQQLKDSKLNQINKEEWYHQLLISDGFNHREINIREPYGDYVLEQEVVELPFNIIDQSPLFDVCKSIVGNAEQKKCFSEEVSKHVAENFNTKLADNLGLEKGVKRLFVWFKINTLGEVVDVKARAPHPDLEVEASRVINNLPKITPGSHEGKTVSATYSLPISFKIN